MRLFVLVTQAFGGFGGISQFNKALLEAFSDDEKIESVDCYPRFVHQSVGTLPAKLNFVTKYTKGKLGYALGALLGLLRADSDEIIWCGHIYLLPVAALAKILTKSKLVLAVYGVDAWSAPKKFFARASIRYVDVVVSASEVTQERFRKWAEKKNANLSYHVLHTCVDLNLYHPTTPDDELMSQYKLHDKHVLLTLGRLDAAEQYKGVDEVLEVLGDVPDVIYIVAGGGSDLERLKSKAEQLGLSDRVIFTDRVSDEQKHKLYSVADVFVMPGRGEGFGIVYIEALACGLSAIGSVCDGSREALGNGELGILVDPSDRAQLTQAIASSLEQKSPIVPEGLMYFSKENFTKRVSKLLSEIASEGR